MESRKLSKQVMQKILTTSWFFRTCLLIFMQHILPYLSHIFFNFKLVLSLIRYCNFLTSKAKTTCRSLYLDNVPVQDEILGSILVFLTLISYFSAILIVFYQYFTIMSSIHKDMMIIKDTIFHPIWRFYF